jgi:hypothetical protein
MIIRLAGQCQDFFKQATPEKMQVVLSEGLISWARPAIVEGEKIRSEDSRKT